MVRKNLTHKKARQRKGAQTHREILVGRAALTGGLVHSKKVTEETHAMSCEREQVLYVFAREGKGSLYLEELRLRYGGLGTRMGATTGENFSTLVALLRERVSDALFDERLATHPRKSRLVSVSGNTQSSVLASSNASENDLAAHLIVLAHQQGQ